MGHRRDREDEGDAMNIENRPIRSLTPYAKNAKKHDETQIANVAESIRQYGFVQPIVIDRDGVIVIGHCRALAAKKLKLAEVPCVCVDDLTPEQVNALRVVDNKTNESGWDFEKLLEELTDIDLTGFDLDFENVPNEEPKHFWGDETGETNAEYEEFTEKFKPKLTTDDCYTPPKVYEAVLNWAVERYSLQDSKVIRPFYPGGDYQKEDYPAGCVVIDNPPFSILSQICAFYEERSIRYFLFAPGLTLFSNGSVEGRCLLPVCARVIYENGAYVNTGFVTNLSEYKIEMSPSLYAAITDAVNESKDTVERRKYSYPQNVLSVASCSIAKFKELKIKPESCHFIRALDSQKATGDTLFGAGFLLSEKAAAEKAAAEKAAAEKAAAEKWELSDRELEIIKNLV